MEVVSALDASSIIGNIFDTVSSFQFPERVSDQDKHIGYKQALKDKDHKEATYMGLALVFFNQMTGVTILIFHIDTIFA